MDPYQTLGVPRDCSREKVKEVFRARIQLAHPDRGGEIPEFIRLRKAYEQILAELELNPAPITVKPKRAARQDRSPKPSGPSSAPDIVWLDEPGRHIRPPRPPDPHWDAEFLLVDEALKSGSSPTPSDLDLARQTYVSWLKRAMALSSQHDHSWRSRPLNTISIIMVLIFIFFFTCAMMWVLSIADPLREDPEGIMRYEKNPEVMYRP
jgi:hypothetical protein